MVSATWDGETVRAYINGKQTNSMSLSGSITNNTTAIVVGALPPNGGENWNGSLDDVRVYNRALSAAEVLQLYNLGR